MILGCSLLTAEGITCSGEGDLKNCQAMKVLDLLGAGGSYTEVLALDFREGFVLMGHDGPFHLGIADGRPIIRALGLYHGKRGYGVSVETSVRMGPITALALTQTREGRLKSWRQRVSPCPASGFSLETLTAGYGLALARRLSCKPGARKAPPTIALWVWGIRPEVSRKWCRCWGWN